MILKGLGIVSAPLYLFSKIFERKPTEHLIGKGIKPDHLNDERHCRILGKLYVTGLSQTFTVIARSCSSQI
jgi:transposase